MSVFSYGADMDRACGITAGMNTIESIKQTSRPRQNASECRKFLFPVSVGTQGSLLVALKGGLGGRTVYQVKGLGFIPPYLRGKRHKWPKPLVKLQTATV